MKGSGWARFAGRRGGFRRRITPGRTTMTWKGDAEFIREAPSGNAILVNVEGEELWIPESQVHADSDFYVGCGCDEGDTGTLAITEWIATEVGLL